MTYTMGGSEAKAAQSSAAPIVRILRLLRCVGPRRARRDVPHEILLQPLPARLQRVHDRFVDVRHLRRRAAVHCVP